MKRIYVILTFVLLAAYPASAQTTENLLESGNLNGWTMFVDDADVDPATIYKLDNGVLRVEGQPFGFIRTNKVYGNFVLVVQWRWIGTPTNSGVFVYVQDEMKCWPNAIECQLAAGRAGDFVLLGGSDLANYNAPEGRPRPNFPVVQKKYDSSERPADEWNTMMVTAVNGNITVVVNGVFQNEGIGSMHRSGHIALQSEGGPIEFRNVTVTHIP